MGTEHVVVDAALAVRPVVWRETERMMQSEPVRSVSFEELMQLFPAENVFFGLVGVEKPYSGVIMICVMQDCT